MLFRPRWLSIISACFAEWYFFWVLQICVFNWSGRVGQFVANFGKLRQTSSDRLFGIQTDVHTYVHTVLYDPPMLHIAKKGYYYIVSGFKAGGCTDRQTVWLTDRITITDAFVSSSSKLRPYFKTAQRPLFQTEQYFLFLFSNEVIPNVKLWMKKVQKALKRLGDGKLFLFIFLLCTSPKLLVS